MTKTEEKRRTQQTKINLEQAADRIGISASSLRRKVQNGEISHYRPSNNGKIYFTENHLEEFEQRRTFTAKVTV